MKKALAALFSSKKFLVMITAIVAYILARVGWDVDPGKIDSLLGVVAVYLGAQGIADHGKEAALVTAASAAAADGALTQRLLGTAPAPTGIATSPTT